MNGKPSARVTPLMISAMRVACSSLSITQGPAMRKRLPEPMWTSPTWKEEIKMKTSHRRARRERRDKTGETQDRYCLSRLNDLGGKYSCLPARHFFRTMKHFYCCRLFLCPPLRAVLIDSRNERAKERMRLQRLRFEFGMKLATDEMRMVRQFDHLDVSSVGR